MNPKTEQLYSPPIWDFKKKALTLVDPKRKVFDLNQAVPNYLPPENIRLTTQSIFTEPDYAFYTADDGLMDLKEAIAKDLKELYNVQVKSQQICVTAGANNAFFSLISMLLKPDDEILLLTPYYFNYFMSATILNCKVVPVERNAEDHFALPWEKLEKSIGPKSKALVVVNPCNPTGKTYNQEEMDRLFDFCESHNLYLISDEVYNYFHPDYPHPPTIIKNKNFENRGFSIHSYSKTFSLTGFRVGFIVCGEEKMNHFIKVQDSNIICAPRIAQRAALEGLLHSKEWLNEKIHMMNHRLETFNSAFRQIYPPLFELVTSGAYFVYLKSKVMKHTAQEICEDIIKKENLLMLPATAFGPGQENYIRIALGNLNESDIETVITKLANYDI